MAGASGNTRLPKDAQVIVSMLKEAGITEYEPRVVTQLLELTFRYVTSILEEARVYAQHSKKKVVDLDDVKLASTMQLDRSFTAPPARDLLMEVAKARNSVPLPVIKPHYGLRLPPDRHCLSACNYKLRTNKKPVASSKSQPMHTSLLSGRGPSGMGNRGGSAISVKMNSGVGSSSAMQSTPIRTKIMGAPKPVIKFSSPGGSGLTPTMPKIQISSGGSHGLEADPNLLKRKHEPDDFESAD